MDSSGDGASARRPEVVFDGVEISENLCLDGLLVAVRVHESTGEVNAVVRAGDVDHEVAFRVANGRDERRSVDAFAYAEAGDRLSFAVHGERLTFAITSPEGRILRGTCGPDCAALPYGAPPGVGEPAAE